MHVRARHREKKKEHVNASAHVPRRVSKLEREIEKLEREIGRDSGGAGERGEGGDKDGERQKETKRDSETDKFPA